MGVAVVECVPSSSSTLRDSSARKVTPPSVESLANLLHRGSALLRDGQACAARDLLEAALALFPDHPAVRNLLALSLFQLGQLEHALLLYESLHLECPDRVAAKVNVALVLLKLGRASAARPLLEQVVRASPEHRRAWGYLGVALEQLGRLSDAESAFLAGHYASAALRLRERHVVAQEESSASVPDVTPQSARRAMPVYRRKTLPPDPWATESDGASAAPALSISSLRRFTVTLRPPEFVPGPAPDSERSLDTQPPPPASTSTQAPRSTLEIVDEIPFETTLVPPHVPGHSVSVTPKQSRPVVPLLDAALASLLVVPHEASVVVHPTGLVVVGMEGGPDPSEGGFAARIDAMQALAGGLKLVSLPRRTTFAPEPFTTGAAFARVVGTGQLVLSPPKGSRLMPLEMDADVAFLREELIVGFDQALLYDLGRVRCSPDESVSLVRFRGDGVIVLGLDEPFLAFDVRGEEAVTLRTDSLIGWIGLLAPEAVAAPGGASVFINFSGEGTVLFRAPRDS